MNNRLSSIHAIHSLISRRATQEQSQALPNSESSSFSRDLLALVWERMSHMNITERALLISHLRSGGIRTDSAEGPNESSHDLPQNENAFVTEFEKEEDYLDFRHYPISIDWNQIENGENHYYSSLTDYGYFGVSLVTSFSTISKKFRFASCSLYQSILEYYHILASEKLNVELEEYINFLPKFNQFKRILIEKYYSLKELPMIKLVLDIYEHYLFTYNIKQLNIKMKSDYISIANLFYCNVTNKEIVFIYDELSKHKKVIGMFKLLNMFINKTKESYMEHLNKLSIEYKFLLEGTKESLFYV